ncbi:hypothetical protein HII36_30150 [Nonomuraea sp. NN258]|uniref:hypothetical protein n=1 Tax=Nonomuraea antri TaxID=2730852 RepID=UPI0015691F4B|nr:hypothetical protein [Nonomuraea antri]NRQ36064.1 hypothetical protein [Nonomuraea antri]
MREVAKRTGTGLALLLAVTAATAGMAGTASADDQISFVDRLGCGDGLKQKFTGFGDGSTMPHTPTSTADRPVARPSTETSGLPEVSVDFSDSPDQGVYQWTHGQQPNDPRYSDGYLEVQNPKGDDQVAADVKLPEAERLFFSLVDLDFASERITVIGYRDGEPVTPRVIPRDPDGVQVTTNPDGSVGVTGQEFGNLGDWDPRAAADVVFDEPVDEVRVIYDNPRQDGREMSTGLTDFYACQGLDVVKSAGTPALESANGREWIYDVPFTVKVGNTARTGDMPAYDVRVDDALDELLRGDPAGRLAGVTGLRATPPCKVNPGYDGTSDTALLAPGQVLPAGQECTITFTAWVAFPPFTGVTVRNNTASAEADGGLEDDSTAAVALPARVHGDKPGPTPVRFHPPKRGHRHPKPHTWPGRAWPPEKPLIRRPGRH